MQTYLYLQTFFLLTVEPSFFVFELFIFYTVSLNIVDTN